ncbi:expressed hypothetical protein [Trichoplax adhaerens]|uniref:Proteasome subunit alpha type n=1 Tax=Trichoplax adhaerens TaxID=10228 RepID=B3SAI5_TRIAD|nr:expressed hypothetical protein [Trichoplax adhaerens]EDV20266.1 expressed hypothetical protein [Trichoplax adhaerens]|eukprot:XP_002117216.1 expressed hypothetical protein [Trichoplax adhaerens]
MSSIGTGYDLSASQFSPDGRVFQVEYAAKAVESSGSIIAIRCKDGVVIGVEKILSSRLHEKSSNQKIYNVDRHVGMGFAGIQADGRKVVSIARDEASEYRQNYGSDVPLKQLVNRVASYIHAYTLYSSVRPFGVSAVLASYSEAYGPELYMIEPSGLYWGYRACAAGKAKQAVKTELEKIKANDMTCEEIVKEIARIIYVVHDEIKDKLFELELSWVCKATNGEHQLVPADIASEAIRLAKHAMEEDLDDDD